MRFDCTHEIRSSKGEHLGLLGIMGAHAEDAEGMCLTMIADRARIRTGPMFKSIPVKITTTLVWYDE